MSESQRELFDQMLKRSFHPAEWFAKDDHFEAVREEKIMWVYFQSGTRFKVGWYDPDRVWHEDTDWGSRESAAARVHYLNGGNK